MSAQVHITKARDWLEASRQRISLREWIRVVETEQDLKLEDPAVPDDATGEAIIAPEEPGVATWQKPAGSPVHFEYHHGQVNVDARDEAALAKAKAIAARLEARVLTDSGEEC